MTDKELDAAEQAYQDEVERRWGFKAREKALRELGDALKTDSAIGPVIRVFNRFSEWLILNLSP